MNALCILGIPEAYDVINRKELRDWLFTLHNEDGSFKMHEDGEVDIRGVYCAVSVAFITKVYTASRFERTAEWLQS